MRIAARKPSIDEAEEQPDGAGFERRTHPRHRVYAPGVIFIDPGDRSIDCKILNISNSGARVKLAEPVELPNAILILVKPGSYLKALVRWRIGLEAGLEFVG
jgi:hypothetical protein